MKQLKEINLRPVTRNDLEVIKNWRNQNGIWEFNTQYIFLNMTNQRNWFKQITSIESNRKMFIIMYKQKIPLGVCGLINIDKENNSAEVAIIIGNKQFHGKGLGSESLYQLVKYGFSKLKLHKIKAEIFEFNTISFELFEKLNFKHEAIKHQSLWRNSKWWDIHMYSLFKKDYDL